MPEIQLKLDYEWVNAESEKGIPYVFPQELTESFKMQNSIPAVYQWRVHKRDLLWVYVGETESLSRRVQGYLKPGPSQKTNLRIKASFDDFLKGGYEISLDSLMIKSLTLDNFVLGPNGLSHPEARKAIENSLLLRYRSSGINVLNK